MVLNGEKFEAHEENYQIIENLNFERILNQRFYWVSGRAVSLIKE